MVETMVCRVQEQAVEDHGFHLGFAGSFFPDCLLNAFSYFVLEAVGSFPLLPTVSLTTMHHHP